MIVVTGGAGFIGSCFIKKLNEIGRTDIIVVDNIGNTNKWKNLLNKDFLDYFDKTTFIDLIINNELDNRFDKVLSKYNNIDTPAMISPVLRVGFIVYFLPKVLYQIRCSSEPSQFSL